MDTRSTFVLPKGERVSALSRATAFLCRLSEDTAWKVTVARHRATRSDQQNRYLFGVVYRQILEAGALEGWSNDDLHEYFLGEHFGWETLEGFGRKRLRPLRRSSKLSTTEFMDFVAFIQQRMAEHGVYIDDPNEQVAA